MGHGSRAEVVAEYAVENFRTTMPDRYRAQFGWSAARQHARIALERGAEPAHAALFHDSASDSQALCVVAPDAPGLLAAISASLMLEGFDIRQALAYTREAPKDEFEAVDLFWVRRQHPGEHAPLTDQDAAAVRSTLVELLSSNSPPGPEQRGLVRTTPGTAETSVRFIDGAAEPQLTLELETNDRTGLLLAVSAALFAEGVQIVGSHVATNGLRVHDQFSLVEADGSRIVGTRLQRIQLAVLAAVDRPNAASPGVLNSVIRLRRAAKRSGVP